ncbi:MAG: sulfite exporter TauE/SafE family protein [Deltaproteobacteria bacterium]|nr:sulfite exporter TauE/SafE family protein [Deltaproteobacteria bacterium]
MTFPVAGIEISPFIPLGAGFFLTFFLSSAGVSGAFILLPFQVSVLGFTSPGATATNHIFNVMAIPGGIARYIREKRMLWPLAGTMLLGTGPGVVLGSLGRIYILSDSTDFKLFMGVVLALIGSRLAAKAMSSTSRNPVTYENMPDFDAPIKITRFDHLLLEYEYRGDHYRISTPVLAGMGLLVGILGGAYGVGGGALLSPLLIGVFRLPVYTTAGATLFCTWVSSLIAALFFWALSSFLNVPYISPDWLLGLLFGCGGIMGMYIGASLQLKIPARLIEFVLSGAVLSLACLYIAGYFL